MDEIRAALEKEQDEECPKVRYDTRKEARLAVIQQWRKKFPIGSIYYCKKCDGFHLTKRKPSNSDNNTGFRFL